MPVWRFARSAVPPWWVAVAFVLLAAALTGGLWLTPLVAALERGPGLEAYYELRGTRSPPQRVLIVAMNAASASALGVVPRADRWPRRLHARLVSGLARAGAVAIGFDLAFSRLRDAEDDAALAEAIAAAGKVVLAATVERRFVRDGEGRALAAAERIREPAPIFAAAADGVAPFTLPKTGQGVFQFWTRLPSLGDRPSLPLTLALRALGESGAVAPEGLPPLLNLNMYGPLGSIRTIDYPRALELLADLQAAAELFAGKVVLVGWSESNQSMQIDAYRTPFSRADGVDVSGVELCATALANLLDGSSLRRPPEDRLLLLMICIGALLALPWVLAGTRTALLANLALVSCYAAIAVSAFAHWQVWLPLVAPLGIAPMSMFALGLAYRHGIQHRRQRQWTSAFELGLSPDALVRMANRIGNDGRGRTQFAVCLCSDIVAFSRLSEKKQPEEVRNILNAYLDRFAAAVEAHGGYVADTIADSVLALWFADEALPQAAADACAAALRLDREMNSPGPGAGTLPTRLGLHYGPIFYGSVGPDGRRQLHAVGDTVNAASRIEGANKYLKTRVLMSRQLADLLGQGEQLRRLGHFALTGKEQALELLELRDSPLPPEDRARFEEGLEAFQSGEFERARTAFGEALLCGSGGPAAFYLRQCEALIARGAGRGWQGVAVLPGK